MITDPKPNLSTPPEQAVADGRKNFIELWGDMGARWGVPRSMTELHALLFITGKPMNTDEIMAELSISRGNVSMTLRTLLDWGIIVRSQQSENRKDYYKAEQDVWKLFSTVARARKRRELTPLTERLKSLTADVKGCESTAAVEQRQRLQAMLDFIVKFDGVSERFLLMGGTSINMISTLLGTGKSEIS